MNAPQTKPPRTPTLLLLALVACSACAHVKESEIIAVAEPPQTIGRLDTVDTARLQSEGDSTPAAAQRALAEIIAAHMATVGIVRAPVRADGVIVELPAPGWILRARLVSKPEQFCQVTLEPVATAPAEHAVQAAPWSVLDAYDRVHRGLVSLDPPRTPPIAPQRFNQLRLEATAAAAANRDPPLTLVDYARTPRPINDQPDTPYYTPSTDSTLLQAP